MIVAGAPPAALAAKAATTTIPIVFGVGDDPVKLGLVASLARPGGNATGINFFVQEVVAKRLRLLHELVPRAVRVAVLVNPRNASTAESTLPGVQEAAPVIGLQTQILNASTIGEIDAAFATLARERPDALFVAGDAFFLDRRVQFATLTARDRIFRRLGRIRRGRNVKRTLHLPVSTSQRCRPRTRQGLGDEGKAVGCDHRRLCCF